MISSILQTKLLQKWIQFSQLQKQTTPILRNQTHFSTAKQQEYRPKRETKIQIIGGQTYDDVRQIRLVELPDIQHPTPNIVATMHVKRNIIFGTKVHDMTFISSDQNNPGFIKVCNSLLSRALDEAGKEGDQPQGLAALNGLSARVRYLIDNPSESEVIQQLEKEASKEFCKDGNENNSSEEHIIWDAVRSVATQIPRTGHEEVGIGTFLDSRKGWTKLAKEYALAEKGEMILQGEAQIFKCHNGVFVGIEYIGEENPEYWIDAGGAMARFVFL